MHVHARSVHKNILFITALNRFIDSVGIRPSATVPLCCECIRILPSHIMGSQFVREYKCTVILVTRTAEVFCGRYPLTLHFYNLFTKQDLTINDDDFLTQTLNSDDGY